MAKKCAKRSEAQSGAILVEAVIVAAALCCLFGCMLVVHLYCSLQLKKLDDARQDAWNQSMSGCDLPDPDIKGMAESLKSGESPFPDDIIPSGRDASRSFSVKGIFQVAGTRSIKFICNPKPSQKTMNETVSWVVGLVL
jgi:hypothetical protein